MLVTFALTQAPTHAQSFDSARGYYEDATRLIATQEDSAAALIQLRNALQLDPDHVPSLILMGQTLLTDGAPGEAAQMLSEALLHGADPVLVLVPLSQAYLVQGRYAELLREVPVDAAPTNIKPDIYAARAQAYLALGRIDDAGIAVHNALGMAADNYPTRLVRIALDIRLGRLAQALEGAEALIKTHGDDGRTWNSYASALHASGQVGPALEAYERAVELAPENVDARIALVSLYMDQGREAEAADDLSYLEENAPYDPRGAYFRALAAARSGDREAELNALTTAVGVLEALEPEQVSNDPQLQMIGALAHFGLGAYAKARALLETYLVSHSGDLGATRLLASSMLALEDYRGVVTLLAPLQRRYPRDSAITGMLAAAYSSSGEPARAADLLESLDGAGTGERASDRLLGTSLLDAGNTSKATQILERVHERNPGQSGVDLPLAIAYLRDARWEDAISTIQRLIEAAPEEPNYRNLLGVAELSRGNRDRASEIFQELLSRNQAFLPARVNLARIRLAEGDIDGARSLLDAALSIDPDSHRAMAEQSRLHISQGELDDALRWVERAVQAQPANLEYRELLVETHLRRDNPAAAEEAARRAAADNADNLEAGLLHGRTQARIGKPKQAALTFTRLSREADFNTALLYRIALLQADLGEFSAALSSLSNALKGDPGHLPSRIASVQMQLELEQYENALEGASLLAADHSEDSRTHILRGEAFLALDQYSRAIDDFSTARATDNNPEASLGLLRAYRAAGMPEQLINTIETYFAAGGTDPRLRAAKADLLIAAKDWAAAAETLESLIADYPNAAPALNNAAFVLQKLGNMDKAIGYARRARTLAPDNPMVNDTLGWLLVENGDPETGLGFLREAVSRAADVPELQYHLAVALHRLGRDDEAVLTLRRALRDAPVFPGRRDAENLLAMLDKNVK